MSFFQKPKILLKKTYIIHFFSVRIRDIRDLTFMLLCGCCTAVTCRPLCCGFQNRQKNRTKGPKDWKVVLGNSCIGHFRGCFEYMVAAYFGEMEQNRLCRIGWSKRLGGCFGEFLHWSFSGMF